jgi:hypothetical protein
MDEGPDVYHRLKQRRFHMLRSSNVTSDNTLQHTSSLQLQQKGNILKITVLANSERKAEVKRPQRLAKINRLKFKESENKSSITSLDSFANCYHNQKCDVTNILSYRLNHYGSQQHLSESATGVGKLLYSKARLITNLPLQTSIRTGN